MIYQVCFFLLFCSFLTSIEHVYLKTPDLSSEALMSVNVGVRPYRRSGVRIESEVIQDKWIIHNYGYGGAGITLCFGGSKEVLEIIQAKNLTTKTVAVLGAGVVGLAVAYDLLQEGYEVHLYAADWSPNLTSNVAAGIWSPLSLPDDASLEKKQLCQRLLQNSEKRFLSSTTNPPEFEGVRFIDSYGIQSGSLEGALLGKFRGDQVVLHFDNGLVRNGRRIRELSIDGGLFLEDLSAKVQLKGAQFHTRHFESLEQLLLLDEQIIVNCTSIGSRELFNDPDFIPIRGHLVYFQPQKEIDYLLFQNVAGSSSLWSQTSSTSPSFWVSIYPWSDRIILGGIYERGEESLTPNSEIVKTIIENARKCFSGSL